MKPHTPRDGKARPRRPAPAEAGANLLVHDIKNLAGRLGLLLHNLESNYDDPMFKGTALDVLDDTVMHLRRLAQDLRDHDERVVVKLKLDLNEVLHDALLGTRSDPERGLEVLEYYREIPRVWGDSFLLRRAFACAIENAIEAMAGRGTLWLATTRARRNGQERVTVEIGDTGPGMSEEFLRERLSRPFASTKEDGLGLGMYTFRQVALLHGGSARILTTEGVGTRVRFHFPVPDA